MATGPSNSDRNRMGVFSLAFALAMTAGAAQAIAQESANQPAGIDPDLASFIEETERVAEQADAGQGVAPGGVAGDASNAEADEFFVELHVNDEDLGTVLQMLSIQSQRNIIASNNVNATVTANLYGVTFYEALDAILHVNGYGYLERGSFIYVHTLAELEEIRRSQRERTTSVIRLNYLNATDAAEFAAPLLSADGGQIKLNAATETFNIPENAPVGGDSFAHDATLVVFDFPENLDAITQLIGELDTRPAQVLVEATIMQSQITEDNAFGIDFSLIANVDFADFVGLGGPTSVGQGLFGGAGADSSGTVIPLQPDNNIIGGGNSNVANLDGPATFRAGLIANNASVFMRMLDEVTDTTILSNPKVLSLNRQPARVLVGRKVGYLSTTATDTSTTQSVEFLDTGTQLYFRPFISSDGLIRMELKPQVSEAVVRSVTDATGAAVTIPDEITNELVANVMVRDGQTVVLGGLFRESTTLTRRQIPFLGDLPLIGRAFQGNEDDVDKNEIIFMVTPSIMNDEVLIEQAERAGQYVEAVRAGSREGLLPFSRTKQAQQLLVEAQRAMADGNDKKALHKIRRALELHPSLHEAYRLRAKISGEMPFWPSRSMLEDVVGNEAGSLFTSWYDAENSAAERRANELVNPSFNDGNYDTVRSTVRTQNVNTNRALNNEQFEHPGMHGGAEQNQGENTEPNGEVANVPEPESFSSTETPAPETAEDFDIFEVDGALTGDETADSSGGIDQFEDEADDTVADASDEGDE